MRSKTRLRLFCGSIQFIFEAGDLKKLFYLRTDDNAKEVVAVSPSQSILQCSTSSSSNKVIPSRPFAEGSTAETVIQVAEPRL
jgi:transcription elongation factor